jgi:hypothetical protein
MQPYVICGLSHASLCHFCALRSLSAISGSVGLSAVPTWLGQRCERQHQLVRRVPSWLTCEPLTDSCLARCQRSVQSGPIHGPVRQICLVLAHSFFSAYARLPIDVFFAGLCGRFVSLACDVGSANPLSGQPSCPLCFPVGFRVASPFSHASDDGGVFCRASTCR